jgi:hypothetical protein
MMATAPYSECRVTPAAGQDCRRRQPPIEVEVVAAALLGPNSRLRSPDCFVSDERLGLPAAYDVLLRNLIAVNEAEVVWIVARQGGVTARRYTGPILTERTCQRRLARPDWGTACRGHRHRLGIASSAVAAVTTNAQSSAKRGRATPLSVCSPSPLSLAPPDFTTAPLKLGERALQRDSVAGYRSLDEGQVVEFDIAHDRRAPRPPTCGCWSASGQHQPARPAACRAGAWCS